MLDQRIEGILVRARSLGGIGTTLTFPEFDLSVDLGVCTPAALRTSTIALTHTHADHLSGLPMYLGVRRLFGMASPRLIAPAATVPALESLVASLGVLQGRPFEVLLDPIRLGEDLPLASSLFLHPFGAGHPVPSVGYVVVRRVQKLREEYVGLSSDQIVRLRRERGMEMFRTVEEPLVAVTGDSTAAGMDLDDPLVQRARLLFVEATFVDDQRDLAHVHAGGHARLDELVPRLQALSCGTIVLYHFSQIYRFDEVEAAVQALLPRSLAARTILLRPDEADRL